MTSERPHESITADMLLQAYACGIFPMADNADDPALHWYEPKRRGILPLDAFHLSRSLAKVVRSDRFDVVADHDFDAVIEACAQAAPGREKTWINSTIRNLYRNLYDRGNCHTIEVRQNGQLVGGLYGVSIGGAFFGESMFHTVTDASKVALVHLIARLRRAGYSLLDAQFVTTHLATFGAIEISKSLYQTLLAQAIHRQTPSSFWQTHLRGTEAIKAAV
jgi:leucyl/phenylalanyl-tRNA---protein transferase